MSKWGSQKFICRIFAGFVVKGSFCVANPANYRASTSLNWKWSSWQRQVALQLLIMVEELAPVAQVLDEFPVAIDVGVEMAKLAE